MAAPTICPACGAQAYVCTELHTDGSGPLIHCKASSLHNFPVEPTTTTKD